MSMPPERSAGPGQDDQETTRVLPKRAVPRETLPTSAAVESSRENGPRYAGRYQIVDKLGRGGMATVYRAYDPKIERSVAIKFLHAALSEDEEHSMRFLREARAAGNLSHPNIVTVYDVGEINGRPYMAMELLDGVPLSDLMVKGQLLPLKDVLEIGIQLAQALDYAHSRGVVHRDIKPGNIMRLRNSNTVKVTDFGIAHVKSSASSTGSGHTRVGDVIGTPQYMSPEQAMGHAIDGRSDLFAVGIVLYQLLAGERPFDAETVVALALKITREEPIPIQKRRPDLPPAMRRVVERCLNKAPDKRYQTGQELAEALSRVLWDLMEEQRLKEQPRIIPLRIKWAGLMALIVALVMAATATFITQRQNNALLAQITDYGASLARFIAAQNALAVLGDEWVAVDVSVQEVMKTRDFQSITVLDHQGVVRVSSEPALVGLSYQPPGGETLGTREGGVSVRRYQIGNDGVLGFEAPVVFQGKTLGRVALGIPERPLARLARYTLSLLATLVIVTVLAVAAAMYILVTWFGKPIRLVGESMMEISKGRYDHRIQEQRNDEFGQLYHAFDQMAEALQHRYAGQRLPEMLTGQRTRTGLGSTKASMSVSAVMRPGTRTNQNPLTNVPQGAHPFPRQNPPTNYPPSGLIARANPPTNYPSGIVRANPPTGQVQQVQRNHPSPLTFPGGVSTRQNPNPPTMTGRAAAANPPTGTARASASAQQQRPVGLASRQEMPTGLRPAAPATGQARPAAAAPQRPPTSPTGFPPIVPPAEKRPAAPPARPPQQGGGTPRG
ncbi:MAG: hypothetical protein RJA44_1745 [Pseudomonadota bacterium]|jgi:serine/threonine-protein kinase